MPLVSIIMGSASDIKVMSKAAAVLEEFGVDHEMRIISAHREPDQLFEWAGSLEDRGVKVVIAGAGMAAHLPGMISALFPLPVIGVPLSGGLPGGVDALLSELQMPPGVPVAVVAVDGAKNGALMALRILAASDPEILEKLKGYTRRMCEDVQEKDRLLQEKGYKGFGEN
ncbi:MAG: 5-(carboxyamino)imidazole ribonucleotide mutase [Lachnospiraceae bacterium]|nr:5-(carboxyamino)imidazole ribonucleotide mutase [Lachnospiraceae bacterium]